MEKGKRWGAEKTNKLSDHGNYLRRGLGREFRENNVEDRADKNREKKQARKREEKGWGERRTKRGEGRE